MAFAHRVLRRPIVGRRPQLLSIVLGLALIAAADPAVCSSNAVDVVELPAGVKVEHDGAGGLQIVDGSVTLLRADLHWLSAAQVTPEGSSLRLEVGDPTPARAADGYYSSPLPMRALENATLTSRMMHWPYFHVDDIAFLDAAVRLRDGSQPLGASALGLLSDQPWELRRIRQRPHTSAGRAPWVEFDLIQLVFERKDGDRLYLGVVRLDRREATLLGDELGVVWGAGAQQNWPLALIAARTRSSLEFLAGQAFLTYDRAGEATTPENRWKVPPLCGRCRDPFVEALRVAVRARDGQLQVHTRILDPERLENLSPEGLRIEGEPLGRHLQRARDEVAEYSIPLDDARAQRLVAAAERGSLEVELWTNAGIAVRPVRVEVEVESGTLEAAAQARVVRESVEDVLPSYLSPDLVSSWPNPFRGETTIEIVVPATLGEAFELDPEALARVAAEDPVPFGPNPTVRVRVYNVSGQLVRTLTEEVQNAGRFAVQWNGTDIQGQPVAAGAYYVNVEMGDWSVTRRVLRLAP